MKVLLIALLLSLLSSSTLKCIVVAEEDRQLEIGKFLSITVCENVQEFGKNSVKKMLFEISNPPKMEN